MKNTELVDGKTLSNITFLDFETTGLSDPAAVSLAIIRMEDGKLSYAKYFLINPEKEIEYGAYKVHKISQEMVNDKPTFADIWPEIKPYISGQIVCGHNVRFDNSVILNQLKRYHLSCDDYKLLCTCKNAKRCIDKDAIQNYKLDTLCEFFSLKLDTHHDARDDTKACMDIYKKLVTTYNKKIEITPVHCEDIL